MIKQMCSFLMILTAALDAHAGTASKADPPGFSRPDFERFVQTARRPQLTFRTDAIVVLSDRRLIYEEYLNGYRQGQKHALFSLGKTMINALIGVMEHQGLLHRKHPLSRYYPGLTGQWGDDASIEDLLHMSSGLEWIEEDREDLLRSDPWFAFYSLASHRNMPAWIVRRSSIAKPGTRFNYSSGDSGLLTAVIRGAVPAQDYDDFVWSRLFRPLHMNTVAIERDALGNQALHGAGYASAMDVARLGQLYLDNGKAEGRQLWPADWLRFTSGMAPSQQNPFDPNDRNLQNNQAYGAQIWLNVRRPGESDRPYPELPENALLGLGTRGQILLILPTQKLIFVRMGTDSELSVKARKNYRHRLFSALMGSLR